jgi:hypothetical protein
VGSGLVEEEVGIRETRDEMVRSLEGGTGDEMLRQGRAVHQGPVSDVHLSMQLPQAKGRVEQCFGSGSALILVAWIRIRIQVGKKVHKN